MTDRHKHPTPRAALLNLSPNVDREPGSAPHPRRQTEDHRGLLK